MLGKCTTKQTIFFPKAVIFWNLLEWIREPVLAQKYACSDFRTVGITVTSDGLRYFSGIARVYSLTLCSAMKL